MSDPATRKHGLPSFIAHDLILIFLFFTDSRRELNLHAQSAINEGLMEIPRIYVAFVLILWPTFLVHCEEIHLGILVPIQKFSGLGKGLASTIDIAIEDVYANQWLSRDYNLTYSVKDSNCSALKALGHVDDLRSAHAFIGPTCSAGCISAAMLAAHRNKPIISYSCSSMELRNRELYPTFLRTQPFSRSFSYLTPEVLYRVMLFYNWSRAAIVSPDDNIWAPIAIALRDVLIQNNFTVPYYGLYRVSTSFKHETVMADAKKVSRGKLKKPKLIQHTSFYTYQEGRRMLGERYRYRQRQRKRQRQRGGGGGGERERERPQG